MHENDDPSAEYQCRAFTAVGIRFSDFTPWNAYPWYINRAPSASELEVGAEVLRRLIELLPRLTVVLLQGGQAKSCWRRLLRRHPEVDQQQRFEVVTTYHPSPQALWTPDPDVRAERTRQRDLAYRRVAALLQ